MANLAVVLAGKVPVNLNFSSARDSIESAKEQAELRIILTAKVIAKRLEHFPWTEEVIHLDELLPKMKAATLGWWLLGLLMPSRILARVMDLPHVGDHTEALLLFTSG